MQNIMIGCLDLWIILELTLGVYHPWEPKGDQVVRIIFQMMHGCIGMLEMVFGQMQMPMMSA